MFERNSDVRAQLNYAVDQTTRKIPMWVVAEKLDVSENTFIKWMRTEMDPERKARVMVAIAEVKAELEEQAVKSIVKDALPG